MTRPSNPRPPAGRRAVFAVSRERLAAAAVTLAPVLYFLPALVAGSVLCPDDGTIFNTPLRVAAANITLDGNLPLWNPYIFAGTPLLASVYPGVIYPPNWLFALFQPATAMNVVVITTYHLTIIGTYLYGRRIGMTRIGALMAGVAFTFGGFMITHMGHTSRIAAAAWMFSWACLAFLSAIPLPLTIR